MSLFSLPPEIVSSISAFLSVSDFVSLTSTCKNLHALQDDSSFWRTRVRSDFRIPSQPLLENDASRWQWIYKAVSTQSTVFTWGNDSKGNLGRPATSILQEGWPDTMSGLDQVGNVADVQCGDTGWSTVLLSTRGQLFAAGVVDGTRYLSMSRAGTDLVPVALPIPMERPLEVTQRSIREFSMGRQRLLALSDEGEVLEWTQNFEVAGNIISINRQREHFRDSPEPRPTQIVAGWAHSSAYFPTKGLYYWTRLGSFSSEQVGAVNQILASALDGDVRVVPGTEPAIGSTGEALEQRIGMIRKYLVLENHIIMLDGQGRLFSWCMPVSDADQASVEFESFEPTEMTMFYSQTSNSKIVDIQGSFRNFGVFGQDGSVQICSLQDVALGNTTTSRGTNDVSRSHHITPIVNSALQGTNVIQLAFGDYHYHALHSNGEISSYGKDSNDSGALGLGRGGLALLRGMQWPSRDETISFHPKSDGRRTIWFEPEKFIFLSTMLDKFIQEVQSNSIIGRMIASQGRSFRQVYGEWFEWKGRNWSGGPQQSSSYNGTLSAPAEIFAPYFALKVVAAGWSGAALVLVDEGRARQARERYLLPEYRTQQNGSEENSGQVDDAESAQSNSWFAWMKNLYVQTQNFAFGDAWPNVSEQRDYSKEAKRYIWTEQNFPLLRISGFDISEDELVSWNGNKPR